MTPERWQQIRDLLQQALSLAPGQRSALLDRACASDSELRKEVETLLASSDDVRSSFLQSAPPLRVALSPGTRIGEYEIKSMLGAGGMGEVYRARDARLGRDVAIKVLPALFSADANRLRRFEQEARAAAALNHPNILAVHRMGTHEGSPYLVSELLEGETLREQRKRGRITVRKAIDYGVQIARGLSAAHEKGIVHRDLKPENLFVTKDGRVKILDFGLAKLTQPRPASEHGAPTLSGETEPGAVMGTVGYMSPEQVRGLAADHRTDIFSFGAILYEMLAGKRAFQKETAADTQSAILNEDPPSISQITTSVPPALERVVQRCLEKRPEQRFQSASDLAFALDALSEGRADSSASSATPLPVLSASQFRKRPLWAGFGILVLIAVGWTLRKSLLSQPEPFRRVAITQLTHSGKVLTAALSPDGKYVAYANTETANPGSPEMQSVWLKQISGGEVQIVPPAAVNYAAKGFGGLTFSSDGDFLYMVRAEASDPAVGILYKMPTLGGPLRRIASHVDSAVSLSPDGQRMVFVRNSKEKHNSVLVVAKENGSEERQVAERKDPELFENVAWSPKAATIAATADQLDASGTSYSQLVEIPVQGGSERSVSKERWSGLMGLAWAAHGRGLVVSAQPQPGGPVDINYVPYGGGEVRKITNGPNDFYIDLSVSADSHSLVSVLDENLSDVWVGRFNDPNSFQPITANHRSYWGAWTPDGKIVYLDYTVGNEVWLCNADGTNASQLTPNSDYGVSYFRASPDGRYIVFDSWKTGAPHLWKMDLRGGNVVQLTNSNYDAPFSYPDYSPDGRWVIYAKSGREKGIWKVPIEGGDPVQLNDADANSPAVSPDGKMIAYDDVGEGHPPRVAVMPYGGGPTIRTFEIPGIQTLRWTPDSREIVYNRWARATLSNIWSQPIAGGKPKQLTYFTSESVYVFDVSRDGSRIVVTRSSPLWNAVLIRDAQQ